MYKQIQHGCIKKCVEAEDVDLVNGYEELFNCSLLMLRTA